MLQPNLFDVSLCFTTVTQALHELNLFPIYSYRKLFGTNTVTDNRQKISKQKGLPNFHRICSQFITVYYLCLARFIEVNVLFLYSRNLSGAKLSA